MNVLLQQVAFVALYPKTLIKNIQMSHLMLIMQTLTATKSKQSRWINTCTVLKQQKTAYFLPLISTFLTLVFIRNCQLLSVSTVNECFTKMTCRDDCSDWVWSSSAAFCVSLAFKKFRNWIYKAIWHLVHLTSDTHATPQAKYIST